MTQYVDEPTYVPYIEPQVYYGSTGKRNKLEICGDGDARFARTEFKNFEDVVIVYILICL